MCLEGKFLEVESRSQKGHTFAVLPNLPLQFVPIYTPFSCGGGSVSHPSITRFVIRFSDLFQPGNQNVVSQHCLIIMSSVGHISTYFRKNMNTLFLANDHSQPLFLLLQVCWTLSSWFIATLCLFGLGWWYELQNFSMYFKTLLMEAFLWVGHFTMRFFFKKNNIIEFT